MSHQVFLPIAKQGRAWRGMSWDWRWAAMPEYWRGFEFVRIGIDWPEVEPAAGALVFPANLLAFLQRAAGLGVRVLVSVKGTPAHWRTHGRACGFPDRPGGVEAFARFAAAAASLPGVWGMEVWNEPDSGSGCYVGGVEMPWYGCLRDWGAGAYVTLFNQAYAAIRAAAPGVRVCAGAFMDVDDDYILGVMGGLRAFDAVSFHIYVGEVETGLAKLAQRRAWFEGLAGGREVWISETSLMDDETGERQAEYARRLAEDRDHLVFWYGDPGWVNGQGRSRFSQLVNSDGSRRPGFAKWAKVTEGIIL